MLHPLTCILIEDEPRSRNLMENMIGDLEDLELLASFPTAIAALEKLEQLKPELIILDIRMPGMNGLQFVEKLEEQGTNIPFIFVTAYDEYMIEALRRSATDYLLKPVSPDQLSSAIDRFRNRKSSQGHNGQVPNEHRKGLTNLNHELLRLDFKEGFEIVPRAEIVYLQADQNYTRIILAQDRKLVVSRNIGTFEHLTTEGDFIRVHRSVIIHTRYFRKLNRLKKTCLLQANGNEYLARISREGIKALEDIFQKG